MIRFLLLLLLPVAACVQDENCRPAEVDFYLAPNERAVACCPDRIFDNPGEPVRCNVFVVEYGDTGSDTGTDTGTAAE